MPVTPQAQRAPLLERVLTVIIGNALILAGLFMYYYLVGIYESHWVGTPPSLARYSSCSPHLARSQLHPTIPNHLGAVNWPTSCVCHARWAPIGLQPVPGHTDLLKSHAWFTLPAADFLSLFLLSPDRHASAVVYFSQSAGGVADIEIEVEAFYESEALADDALQPEGTSICVLRRGQGQYGIDVLVSAAFFHRTYSLCMTRVLRRVVYRHHL